VVLEGAGAVEFQQEVAPLPVDQEGWIALGKRHQKRLMAAMARLSTIAMTVTHTTIWTNFLFRIPFFCSRVEPR
jgi:hypothetical protein